MLPSLKKKGGKGISREPETKKTHAKKTRERVEKTTILMTKTTVTRGQTGHVSLGKAGDYTCEEQVNIRLYIYIYICIYVCILI